MGSIREITVVLEDTKTMEFTPEQQEAIDLLVETAKAEAKVGLFTEEDLNKKVTAEVDRRVDTGIKKGIETQRSKWEQEYAAKANMTAEQRVQEEFDEKLKLIAEREANLAKQTNHLNAQNLFVEAGVQKDDYSKFIDILVSDNAELTTTNVTNFIETFKNTQTEIETRLKKQLSIVKEPDVNPDGNKSITKEIFDKMSTQEKVALKQKDPTLVQSFLKI